MFGCNPETSTATASLILMAQDCSFHVLKAKMRTKDFLQRVGSRVKPVNPQPLKWNTKCCFHLGWCARSEHSFAGVMPRGPAAATWGSFAFSALLANSSEAALELPRNEDQSG